MAARKKKKIIKKAKKKKVKKISPKKKVVKLSKKVKIKKSKIASTAIRRRGGKLKNKIVKKVVRRKIKKKVELKRAFHNPVITPRAHHWESKATFNPSAFTANDRVHLIYRAIGDNDTSVLGYAMSKNGYNIDERLPHFVYRRFNNFAKADKTILPIDYISGGGWNGGCEDPRLTRIGDKVYMLYTAFDGWGSLRIALTAINLDDMEHKKWNWKKPVLISPPHEINKNWVLFPEKINGKYAILHSFYPKILINYFDSLDELDGKNFIKSNNTRPVDESRGWDSWFRGVGPAPLKTDLGWLILYHAMDHRNPDRYRIGALILDINNPTQVLYRSVNPILEPEEYYENNGYKWGVVYTCGAVIKDGELIVYYGGADKVIGIASISLAELLNDLKQHKEIRLKKQSTEI
ncbi:MAG: hypothetical protein Q7K54_02655 [Candidatus Parcubacteria bacterium]|nr:hypothetical protein [Candidatus Parcubacteria bacterium]